MCLQVIYGLYNDVSTISPLQGITVLQGMIFSDEIQSYLHMSAFFISNYLIIK